MYEILPERAQCLLSYSDDKDKYQKYHILSSQPVNQNRLQSCGPNSRTCGPNSRTCEMYVDLCEISSIDTN